MDDTYSEPIVDRNGNVMFWCDRCRLPMSRLDILDLGMRMPDYGESTEDYLDSELIDSFRHPRCVATKAG